MKTKYFLLMLAMFCGTHSFSQVKKINIVQKPITANQATQASPVKTTAAQTQVKAQPIMTVNPSNLIFLNQKDKANAAKLERRVAIRPNPAIKKMSEYSKVISYADGTKIHMSLTKNQNVISQGNSIKANTQPAGQDQENGMDCITTKVSLSATSTDFMNNNYGSQIAHIYPGAIYTYDHLYDGSFREETSNRNPLIIACTDNPNMYSPTFETVTDPNQANISNALAKLFSRFTGPAANESIAYQIFEADNNADMNIKLGAGGSGYGFTFSALYNSDRNEQHIYMTIDARKSLFSMSAAIPDSGFFKTHVDASTPLVVIGSVSYGIRVLANIDFTFKSQSDLANFRASYAGWGVSANADISTLMQNSAASTNVNVYIIGGPSSQATTSVTKDELKQKIDAMLAGATYQNAKPISYELFDMDGNVIGEQSATDQFTINNCVPKGLSTNMQNPHISILSGEDGKDKDTHYTIELFNSNGQQAAMYVNNSNSDEYAPNESEPVDMTGGTPTGEIKYSGSLPLPVMRVPVLSDFSNGGKIHITITPNGHDTWKIQSLTLKLSFQNDLKSPHTITWTNKTLSQDSRQKDFSFDSGFNANQ